MDIAIGLIGGLGLFLYGMTIMGDSLQKAAGTKMKAIIGILTKNRIIGVVVGATVTMIIQSSSATTVMVVGFVNAGIMSLVQATGIIMGANIGTTVTAQLVSLNLSAIAPGVVGVAVVVWIFSKNTKTKNVAEIFIGFGILFIGMSFMKNAVKPLRELEAFHSFMLSLTSGSLKMYLMAIGVGFVFTAVVQSSSATTGILIAMASEGIMPLEVALPIIFGTNIGTCVTALISSIGANRTAKKAAFIHFMFNILGTLIFVIFFRDLTIHVAKMFAPADNVARQLANAHTFFNIANTLMLLPFSGLLVRVANRMIPDVEELTEEHEMQYLDERMLETPGIAIAQVVKAIIKMGDISLESYDNSVNALIIPDEMKAQKVLKQEYVINSMEHNIAEYLVKLTGAPLSMTQHEKVNEMFNTINDIERIGDHAENIAELAIYRIENTLKFSEKAVGELRFMHERVLKSCKQAIKALETHDSYIAKKIIEREGEIDHMEKSLRTSHISRLNDRQCSAGSGVVFLDAITNLERIGDHAEKIAFSVIDATKK